MSNRDKPWFPAWDARRTLMMDESPEKKAEEARTAEALAAEALTARAWTAMAVADYTRERREAAIGAIQKASGGFDREEAETLLDNLDGLGWSVVRDPA